jgi:exosortase/archaeosortase family protein
MQSDTETYSIRYVLFYVLLFLAVFFIFQFIPSGWFEFFTAQVSSKILNILGLESSFGVLNGFVFLTLEGGVRDVNVLIIKECTAIHVWGILIAMVVPLKADLISKIKSISFGVVLVLVMNFSRILLTLYLSGYDVPPFSFFFQNPTVETFHYPISFIYGVIGIMILIISIDRLFLPELGSFLIAVPEVLIHRIRNK